MERLRSYPALVWMVAVVGFPIGGLLAQAIAGPASTVPAAFVSGLIAGAVIGLAQALTLGLRSQSLAIWVGGTAAGLGVGLAIVTALIGQIETSTEAIALGTVSGVLIGAAQSYVLMRAGVANAWTWIAVTAIAWAVGWLVTSGVGVTLAPGWPVYGLSGAIVSQVITGVAVWRQIPTRGALVSAR